MNGRPERPLGRGLGALIPQRSAAAGGVTEIPLSRVQGNPHQPRQRFDLAELEALAASIREHGVIQPILVTESVHGYQLIAGERRVRAARLAGLERIPAIVRQLGDSEQLELALVENLQREDLNAIESAHGYRHLIDDFGFTQERLAERVGRARPTIANTLRLLELDPAIQEAIAADEISEGHGRALGALPQEHQRRLLPTIVSDALSVRQTEELVRRLREPRPVAEGEAAPPSRDPDRERVEEELRRALGTKVSLSRTRRGGRIVIEYYSEEELGRLYERLVGRAP
jgi:ParB family transcriptional regulator, chromosome partitioning protein